MERTAEEAWPDFRGWRVNYESVAYRLCDRLPPPLPRGRAPAATFAPVWWRPVGPLSGPRASWTSTGPRWSSRPPSTAGPAA